MGSLVVCLATLVVAASADVEQGLKHFERLEYDRAVVVLGRALTREDLARHERTRALETLAFSYVILADTINAEQTFHRLLDHDPDHRVQKDRSPRFREAFEAALESWKAGRAVSFQMADNPDQVVGRIQGDPLRVGSVVTVAKQARVALRCEKGECTGERPTDPFTIELLDHRGSRLSESGPYEARASASKIPSWVVWAAVGAGLLAGGITIAVVASNNEPPGGSLGSLQLP